MGVSLCSRKRTVGNIYHIRMSEDWSIPDEESTHDEKEYYNSLNVNGMRRRTMPADLRTVLGEVSAINLARKGQLPKSSGCSLQDRMRHRRRLLAVDRKMKDNPKLCSEIVTEDSLKRLRHTIRLAGSIAEKGSDINKELARQERVMFRAASNIAIAEYETDLATEALNGMSPFRGKLATVLWKKKPKLKVNTSKNIDVDLINREVGLFSFSRMTNCNLSIPSKGAKQDRQQKEIKVGLGHLDHALDVITIQQTDTEFALNRHEELLSLCEDQITTTNQKVKSQSWRINQIRGRS